MDSGLVQSLAAALVVFAAALFLGRRAWRAAKTVRHADGEDVGCGAGGACGCERPTRPIDVEALSQRD